MEIYDIRSPAAERPMDHVELGHGAGEELDRRLLGEIAGRRVLLLGVGAGHDAVGLALRGARVTAVESDSEQLAAARSLASANEVVVEFHQSQLAELAFVRADQVDLAVSVASLAFVDDLDRVFRQVHRVIRPGAHLVVSVPHPARLCADPIDPRRVTRRWDDDHPVGERHIHRAEDLVTALVRANFEIDAVLERHRRGDELLPDSLIVRATKLGT